MTHAKARMDLEEITLAEVSHKGTDAASLRLYKVQIAVRFIETESRMVTFGVRGQVAMEDWCLVDAEFRFCKMKGSEGGGGDAVYTECTCCH